MSTKTRFEKEAKGNSEMVYCAETCFCSLHCSDKGKITCHHGNVNFSRVRISNIWGKAQLIRYFIGVYKINAFFSCSINLSLQSVVHCDDSICSV